MSRRELREQLFKLLFRIEFNAEEEMPQQERKLVCSVPMDGAMVNGCVTG